MTGRLLPARWRGAARSRPAPGGAHLAYPGLARPVALADAPEVAAGLGAILSGWEPRSGPAAGAPFSRVARERGGGFRLDSVFLDAPLTGLTTASAVCGVVADLSQAFYEERPDWLALHCGAFRLGGRLVALTGAARAGKSTLIARMTAEPGVEVFCDDVLPVGPDGRAQALGVAPRLRLPLPAAAGAAFRAHVAANAGPSDDRYAYLPAASVARHGTRAPLSALVVLARRPEGPARLHRLDQAAAVRHLLARNMAGAEEGGALLARADALARDLFRATLAYSDLEEAAALLVEVFGARTLPDPARLDPPLAEAEVAGPAPEEPADPRRVWRRAPGVALRRIGGEVFLWQDGRPGLSHLNPVAAAVWRLLEEPQPGAALADTLAAAFPEEDPARILRDVGLLLAGLEAEELILEADA